MCEDAQTAEACAAAASEFGAECSWLEVYTATVDGEGACAFEPAQGLCVPPAEGDTGCGAFAADCGYTIFGSVDDGTLTLTRSDAPCSVAPPLGGTFEDIACHEVGDETGTDAGALPEDQAALCACGCAPNYPTD